MKELIFNFWNKFKNQPDIWFFFGFLLTFSFSIRKVIFYFPIQGTFNEYSGIYIYISDITLLLTLIIWLIYILHNNKIILSSIKLWIRQVFHNLYLFLPLLLIFLSFLSISYSENKSIAFFRSTKLLEFYFLYIYTILQIVPQMFHACPPEKCSTPVRSEIVPRGTISKGWNIPGRMEHSWKDQTFRLFSWIIIFLGLFQSIIGIIQFLIQKSIGLLWFKESLISPEVLGVAKIILNEETYIRAYGLMPHPNVLGGFLLFSIIITLLYKKLFHACLPARQVEQFRENEIIWIFRIIISIQIIALILTFSKSAMLGLLIAFIYINVPRRTFSDRWNILGRMEHSKALLLSGLIILTFFFLVTKPDFNSLFFNSLKERSFGYKTVLNVEMLHACPVEQNCSTWNNFVYFRGGIFTNDPILGVGIGQSVLTMQKFYPKTLQFWEYQPIHNVFLLILSELGLFGFILFIWWFWKLFHVCPPEEYSTLVRQKIVPRGTILGGWNIFGRMEQSNNSQHNKEGNNSSILNNNTITLSIIILSRYFKGILLGFIFIMLFDHYLWDIQQGSLLFWMTAGFVAGINNQRKGA